MQSSMSSSLPPIAKTKGARGSARARARQKKVEGRARHAAAWQGSPSSFFELTWSSTANRHIKNHQNPPTLLAYDARTTVVGVPDASGASQLNDGAARDSRAARAAVLRGEDLLRRVRKLGEKDDEAAPAAQLIQMLQEACEHFGAAGDRELMIEAVHVRGRVLGDRALRRSSARVREHDFDGCVDALREAAQHFSVLSSGAGLSDAASGSSSTQPRRSDEAVAAAAGGPELEHRQRRKAADDSARLERCVNPAVATVKLAMKDAHTLITKHSSELRRKAFVSALDSACMAEKSASWAVSRCERMCRVDANGTVEASPAILELLASAKALLSSCGEAQQAVAIDQQLDVGRELLAMVASARLGASDAQIARLAAAQHENENGNRTEERDDDLAEAGASNDTPDSSVSPTNATQQQAAVPPMVVRRQMLSTVLSQSVAAFGDLLLQDLRSTKLQQLWSMAEVLRKYSCLASDDDGDMGGALDADGLAATVGTDPVTEDGYEDERKDFIAQARAAAAQAVAQVQEEEDRKEGDIEVREDAKDGSIDGDGSGDAQQEASGATGESSQLVAKAVITRVLRDTARAAKLQWTLYGLSKDATAHPLGLSRRVVVRRAFAAAQKQIGFALDSVLTSVMVPVSPSYTQQLNAVRVRLNQQLKAARLALAEAKAASDKERDRLQAAHKELLDSDRARREAIAVAGERGWRKALMDRDAVIHATQEGCGIKLLEEQPDMHAAVDACVELINSLEQRLEKSVVQWHSTEETTSAALSQLENDVTAGAEKMHRVETKVRREKHKLELKYRIKHVETRRHAMQRELDKARDISAACTSMVMTGPYGLADDDEVTAQRTICAKRIETVAFNLSTDIDVDTSDAETEKALDILALGVAKALEEAKHTHALLESKSEELELAKLKRDEQEAVERERIREEVLVPARAELNKLRAECEEAGVVGAALLELDVVKKAIFSAEEALSQAALACGRPVETKYAATMGAMLQIVRENCVLAGDEARASLKIVRAEVARLRAELDERRMREKELRNTVDEEVLAPARAALDAGEAEIASHAHGLRDDTEVAKIMAAAAKAHASVAEQRAKPLDVDSEDTLQSSLQTLREAAEVVAELVRGTMTQVSEVRAGLDKAHKQRQNKDKQTRDKLRNRTLGMARQQLRMTESLLKIDEQLTNDTSLMAAIANAHAEIEKADSFLQESSDLSSDATLEADTEVATTKANGVLAIAQDVMDQANNTAAQLKKAREAAAAAEAEDAS